MVFGALEFGAFFVALTLTPMRDVGHEATDRGALHGVRFQNLSPPR